MNTKESSMDGATVVKRLDVNYPSTRKVEGKVEVWCPYCGNTERLWVHTANEEPESAAISCRRCRRPFLVQYQILVQYAVMRVEHRGTVTG